MDDFIGPLQSSFIRNRGAFDNVIIAQEIAHHIHKKNGKKGILLFKVDFEKVYNGVDWNFLRLTLTKFEFAPFFMNLIMSCITSS